jgi:hypothetical protein
MLLEESEVPYSTASSATAILKSWNDFGSGLDRNQTLARPILDRNR